VAQLVVFALVATSALIAMQIWSMASPEAAHAKLEALRAWIDRHRNRAITILAAVVGLWLTIKGGYGLITQSRAAAQEAAEAA
jgi:Sap, sulfolipid-1-addressing protein